MVARADVSHPFPAWCANHSGADFGYRALHLHAFLGATPVPMRVARVEMDRPGRMRNLQARVLFTVFYRVLVFPFGIVAGLVVDHLAHQAQPSCSWNISRDLLTSGGPKRQ